MYNSFQPQPEFASKSSSPGHHQNPNTKDDVSHIGTFWSKLSSSTGTVDAHQQVLKIDETSSAHWEQVSQSSPSGDSSDDIDSFSFISRAQRTKLEVVLVVACSVSSEFIDIVCNLPVAMANGLFEFTKNCIPHLPTHE